MRMMNAIRNMDSLQKLTIGSLCSNVILATGMVIATYALVNEHERIVLVPPHLDRQVQIAWNSADTQYVKSFGLYIATLVGNIQPRTSSVVLETVAAFMDPEIYSEFRRQTRTVTEDPIFKQSGAVITFQPSIIKYEPETSRVFVSGALITKSAGTDRSKSVTYEIGLQIRYGRPWVHHFTSYEGATPHLLSWHVTRAEKEGRDLPDYLKRGYRPDVPNEFIKPLPVETDMDKPIASEKTASEPVEANAVIKPDQHDASNVVEPAVVTKPQILNGREPQ